MIPIWLALLFHFNSWTLLRAENAPAAHPGSNSQPQLPLIDLGLDELPNETFTPSESEEVQRIIESSQGASPQSESEKSYTVPSAISAAPPAAPNAPSPNAPAGFMAVETVGEEDVGDPRNNAPAPATGMSAGCCH